MTRDSSPHAYKRLQDRPKTAPSGHGASQGRPQEAKIAPQPTENQCFLPSRLFASDGLLRPQDGPKMAQESPKRSPREAQDGPKSAQERPKSGPRGAQEATFWAPTGGQRRVLAPFLIDRPKMAPRDLPDPPKEPQKGPKTPQNSPRSAPGDTTGTPKWHKDPQHIPKKAPG